MKCSGQMQIEALITFVVFLAIISTFIGVFLGQAEEVGNAGDALKAKMQAEKCATVVDALYSNSGIQLVDLDLGCFSEGENMVKGKFNGAEKEAFVFAKELNLVQAGNKTILEVEVNEHYR